MSTENGNTIKHQVVVVGGGSGGITAAAHLLNQREGVDVAIIEPSDKHYYQPLWTLVGGGVFPKEETEREEADLIPRDATWIKDAVTEFHPDDNYVMTKGGKKIQYDYLIVAPGIQINWGAVKGLEGHVGEEYGIGSNYTYETAETTWNILKNMSSGTAIFTQPSTPIKCGGAPQKIAYLAEDHFRRSGVRDRVDVIFASAGETIFGVQKYIPILEQVIDRKGITTKFQHELVEVRPNAREAVFENLATGEEVVMSYDMLHVSPPQGPPDFVKNSPLADEEEGGWLDVDPFTLQHTKYDNVYGLGDVCNLPTAKTGAGVRKQAPVVVNNLLATMEDRALRDKYDGYTSCPVITGYGTLILAEFGYDGEVKESFPFDQAQERYSMYMLKKYALPRLYWHGMLKGRA